MLALYFKNAKNLLVYLVVIFVGFNLNCSHKNNLRNRLAGDSTKREHLKKERDRLGVLHTFSGMASYYGKKFQGKKTASGETFDMNKLTGAHPTLPFGTKCRVTNLDNQKSVIIQINDRGPFVENRILDLSMAAARHIDAIQQGVFRVKVEVLEKPAGED